MRGIFSSLFFGAASIVDHREQREQREQRQLDRCLGKMYHNVRTLIIYEQLHNPHLCWQSCSLIQLSTTIPAGLKFGLPNAEGNLGGKTPPQGAAAWVDVVGKLEGRLEKQLALCVKLISTLNDDGSAEVPVDQTFALGLLE